MKQKKITIKRMRTKFDNEKNQRRTKLKKFQFYGLFKIK
jgi:hypothetical protein